MSELDVLQAVRLKGRVTKANLAATLHSDHAAAAAEIAALVDAGLLVTGETIRISPKGRKRLAELLAEERSGIDQPAMTAAYAEFRSVNSDFKSLVTAWQIRDNRPNTHEDAEYDGGILAQLDGIHDLVLPIIAAAATQLPRLGSYADKLSASVAKIAARETIWFTRPLIDSYHTVWFELYEELLQAAGLTREDETEAGYAP